MTQTTEKLGLYWRTIEHVPTEQVLQRLRLRVQQKVLGAIAEPLSNYWRSEFLRVEWPSVFVPLDVAAVPTRNTMQGLREGVFDLAGERINLAPGWAWEGLSATRLARWQLHYWEWAWTLLQHEDREASRDLFGFLWRSWTEGTEIGKGDAWSTYPTSLRAWVFVNFFCPLVKGSELEADFLRVLRWHQRFIHLNLERDLGGNHLVKNLKALIGLAVFFGEPGKLSQLMTDLKVQVGKQLLADGGHFERSASYHAQVLGDLIDIWELTSISAPVPDCSWLEPEIDRMRDWLCRVTIPSGRVAGFNDCVPVGKEQLAALGAALGTEIDAPQVLVPSGLVILGSTTSFSLIFNAGSPSPPELPGHAHSDCLSAEISHRGLPLIVDPGVSTYEQGDRRNWERSTGAHNTIEIDGLDQSEMWSVFRVGRLAQAELNVVEMHGPVQRVIGAHRGYRRLPGRPEHRREIEVAAGLVRIDDFVTGSGMHRLSLRLTFAPGIPVVRASADVVNAGKVAVTVHLVSQNPAQTVAHEANRSAISVQTVEVAEGFGKLRKTRSLVWSDTVSLPVHVCTEMADFELSD